MTAPSDTPRTDMLDNEIKCNPPSDAPAPYRASEYEAMVNIARQLERELAEAKQDAERLDWLLTQESYCEAVSSTFARLSTQRARRSHD